MERNLLQYIWKLLLRVCFDLDASLMCLGTEGLSCHVLSEVNILLYLVFYVLWCIVLFYASVCRNSLF